ncbi:MAG TPA: FxsA family protein [Modicisalibacter sp.]|nr:FxsA family protein [Modicisalibacter sp.]
MPLLAIFTLFALLDFIVLFAIGSEIGLLTTLLLIVATGFVGLHLVRREGVATLRRAQQRLAQGEIPSDELMTGAALIFGGALLISPGFLSDTLGLLCLLPVSRRLLGRLLVRLPFKIRGFSASSHYRHGADGWNQQSRNDSENQRDEAFEQEPKSGTPIEGDFIAKDEPRH